MTRERHALRALPSWGAGTLVVLVGLGAILLRTVAELALIVSENATAAGRLSTALLADGAERAEIAIQARYQQEPHAEDTAEPASEVSTHA